MIVQSDIAVISCWEMCVGKRLQKARALATTIRDHRSVPNSGCSSDASEKMILPCNSSSSSATSFCACVGARVLARLRQSMAQNPAAHLRKCPKERQTT